MAHTVDNYLVVDMEDGTWSGADVGMDRMHIRIVLPLKDFKAEPAVDKKTNTSRWYVDLFLKPPVSRSQSYPEAMSKLYRKQFQTSVVPKKEYVKVPTAPELINN